MDREELKKIVQVLIFASESPLSVSQMQKIVENAAADEIEAAIEDLREDYESQSIFLKRVSGGYQFATRPEYSRWVRKLLDEKIQSRLSRAALESLAIIAFKQPITKVEVSAIRGVNSDGAIKTLLQRRLITITGRDKGPGRALLFSTTKEFLQYFGLDSIADLPRPKEIDELLAEGEGGNLLANLPEEALLKESIEGEADKKSAPLTEEPKGEEADVASHDAPE